MSIKTQLAKDRLAALRYKLLKRKHKVVLPKSGKFEIEVYTGNKLHYSRKHMLEEGRSNSIYMDNNTELRIKWIR